jgi:methionyl-tRNA formyltransferase
VSAPNPRVIVCAYGEIGAASLETLLELGVDVALVVTHEDAPGERIWFRSVADVARGAGVRAIAPANVNAPEVLEALAEAAPDFLFSFYFRHMLSRPALAVAKRGALNLHGSLLPRFRGRAPVNWALIEGERETGVTLHYMDEKPDHGDIVAQRAVTIGRDDSALSLTHALAGAARELLRETIPQLAAGTAARIAQDHARSTYYGGRRPEDGAIDWRAPAERVRNLIRAVTDPWPGAFTSLRGRSLSIWWAETAPLDAPRPAGELFFAADGTPCVATGEGALALARVSWSGEPPEDARAWARRAQMRASERCESGRDEVAVMKQEISRRRSPQSQPCSVSARDGACIREPERS